MRRNPGILMFVLAALTPLVIMTPRPVRAADAPAAPKVTYDEHIKPIFRAKCGTCHNTDKKTAGLDLTNYTAMMQGGGSGAVIEKGDSSFSYLWMVVSHQSEPYMPPNSPKIDEKSLNLIREWIDSGAPENAGSKVMEKKKVDLSLSGVPTGKPEGPPPMPPRLPLEPTQHTSSANATTALAASPWAPLVAVGGFKQVLLYNTQTLELAGILPFPEGTPHILRFSRNGKLLLAGGGRGAYQGVCAIWDITTGKRITTVGDETDAILAADISPNQKLVALGGPSKKVRVYSIETGELVYQLDKHTEWIYALEFSPDNVLLATADRNGGLVLWEAATGSEYLVLDGHKQAVNAVSWRTDSNLLASCDDEGKVYLWEMENGKAVRNWTAHGGGAKCVEFTRDGRLVTCGVDKTAKLWGVDGKQQQAFPAFNDIALDVTYAAEGDRVIAGDWLGDIRVWNAKDAALVGTITANPPTLQMRIDAANAAAAKAQQEVAAVDKQVKAAEAVMKQADAAVAQVQAEIAAATTARQEMEKQIQPVKAQVDALTAQRDKAAAEAARLQPIITSLTAGIEQVRAAAKSDGSANDLTVSLQGLEASLAARAAELTAQQTAAAHAGQQLAAPAEQLKAVMAKAAEADMAIAAAQAKLAPLETDRKTKAETLAALQKTLAEKQTPLTAAQAQVKRWQDELAYAATIATPENAQASAAATP